MRAVIVGVVAVCAVGGTGCGRTPAPKPAAAIASTQPVAPHFLGLPDDQSKKVGDDHPGVALADMEVITAVHNVTYAEYQRRKEDEGVAIAEKRGDHVYFAVLHHRTPKVPGSDRTVTIEVLERYKAPLPSENE
jgi:hypothetical protein